MTIACRLSGNCTHNAHDFKREKGAALTLTETANEAPDRPAGRSLPADRSKTMPAGNAIPAYIEASYRWAYMDRRNARLLDREAVVAAILFGNNRRLRQSILRDIEHGQSVLQVAHVYGRLIPEIARRVGPNGSLDVVDIVPLQAALCRYKLRGLGQARVRIADACEPGERLYDVVSCYFLLHEVPDVKKRMIVGALLDRVAPGGRAIFIDYHRPSRLQPLRGFYRRLFERVEPYALSMWQHDIQDLAGDASAFQWEKRTLFGGVFQKTVAYRPPENVGPVEN